MAASEGNILIPLYSYRKIKPQKICVALPGRTVGTMGGGGHVFPNNFQPR